MYGLKKTFSNQEINLQLDIPSVCAQKFIDNKIDIGLVPAAIIKKISPTNYFDKIISSFCIGSENKVDSVMLYSNVPLAEIETIVLDYQSKTSVELIKILCEKLWFINPLFVKGEIGYEKNISGAQAALIIGDRTFKLKNKFKFEFDLAQNWTELTNMPFVFACWVTNKKMPDNFLIKFDAALKYGYENIDIAIQENKNNLLTNIETQFYLKRRISYQFNQQKKEALQKFLNYLT